VFLTDFKDELRSRGKTQKRTRCNHDWVLDLESDIVSCLLCFCIYPDFDPPYMQEQKLDRIIQLLMELKAQGEKMAGELDALTAQVTANTDAESSAITLLKNLHDLLVAAGTDPVKLAALTSTLKTSSDALAASIVANTPAAPAPAP